MAQPETLDTVALARKRLRAGEDFETEDREEARVDWRFYSSEQWSEEDRAQRETEGRPCVTMNQIKPKVRQILNQIRKTRPQATVIAQGDAEDQDAEAVEGLLRRIQTGKFAEAAHDWAAECALVGGFGHSRVIAEYPNERAMHQELKIAPIKDPFAVVWDPYAQMPDKSDAGWCIVKEWMARDAFEHDYPNADISAGAALGLGDEAPRWITDDGVLVADYFYITHEKRTLYTLPGGQTAYADELAAKGVKPNRSWPNREVDCRKVNWQKINGLEVLETFEWRGKYIPVVTVIGEQLVLDGKPSLRGFVRDLRDPQTGYNWMTSAVYESIGVGAKAPFIAPEGMLENHREEWRNANRENRAVLEFKPLLDASGNPLPFKPERNAVEPPIQAVTEARVQADQDMKGISGMFDPALGQGATYQQSQGTVQALQGQSDVGTFNFGDNLVFAMEYEARVILDLLPYYYDSSRVIEVEGRTKNKRKVQVFNSNIYTDSPPPMQDPKAEALLDLAKGQYEPTVTVGPSFETQKQKDLEFWLRLAEGDPITMQIGRDIIYDLVDSPESKAMAERAKAVLPPAVLQQMQGGQMDPAQMHAQLIQLQQQNQVLMQHNQQLMQELQTKAVEAKGRLAVEHVKSGTALAVAASRERVAKTQAQAEILTHAADKHTDIVHDHAMADKQQAQALALQEAQAQHDEQMLMQQHRNTAEINAQQRDWDLALQNQEEPNESV